MRRRHVRIIGPLEAMSTSNLDPHEIAEDHRTLYEDAGEWSRHYSNVRMTIATFVITSCVAIIALSGEKAFHNPHLIDGVCLLWLLGLFIFYAFTFLSFKERNRQLIHRRALLAAVSEEAKRKKGAAVLRDPASWALLVINTAFAFVTVGMPDAITSWPNDVLPWILFPVSVLSLLFIVLADLFIRVR